MYPPANTDKNQVHFRNHKSDVNCRLLDKIDVKHDIPSDFDL